MPAFLLHPLVLFAFSNLKRDLKALWGWLCHRSFWQLMFGAALIFSGIQTLRVRAEQRHTRKVESQLSKVEAQLKSISSARDTQKAVTKTNIQTVTKIIHEADGRARIVEQAPPAAGCKTKPEVMGADL